MMSPTQSATANKGLILAAARDLSFSRLSTTDSGLRSAQRRLQREQEPKSLFVFTSGRGSLFTTTGFARMVERAGRRKLGGS